MPFHRLVSLLVLCVFSLARAGTAEAQTTAEKASAELLFDEALSLMRNGSFAEACPKLESSQRIDPAVGTLLYLSECYERQGRTASAWVTFREAAALARSEGQLERASIAERRAAELQQALALVAVEISPEARQIPGLEVRCGSVAVDVSLGTISVPVDPGHVAVEASAPEHVPFTKNLEVEPNGRGTIVIPRLTRVASSATAASPVVVGAVPAVTSAELVPGVPASAPAISDSEPRSTPVASIVLGGVGVVSLGVGAYFGVKAMSDADEANELCPGGSCTSQRGEDLMHDARTSATVSNIAFGVGIASLATGLVLYFVDPDSEQAASGLAPFVADRGAGLAWRGRL
ncbi:MAG TPA: hypothetical protein VFU02_16985 [Polyangiaceae bacterium]|nr:hypothetical protein [Polyangiaceae bacterium]